MIGAIRADDDALVYNISSFVVSAELRGLGIGRALWQRLWTDLRARYAALHPEKKLIVLLSTGKNNHMREYYERKGFRRLGPPPCISDPTLQSPWDMLYWKGMAII